MAQHRWLPPREGKTAEVRRKDVWGEHAGTDYVCLHAVNLMRRFGEDIETLRRFYADRYYGWIYRTVKEIDPNHLY